MQKQNATACLLSHHSKHLRLLGQALTQGLPATGGPFDVWAALRARMGALVGGRDARCFHPPPYKFHQTAFFLLIRMGHRLVQQQETIRGALALVVEGAKRIALARSECAIANPEKIDPIFDGAFAQKQSKSREDRIDLRRGICAKTKQIPRRSI